MPSSPLKTDMAKRKAETAKRAAEKLIKSIKKKATRMEKRGYKVELPKSLKGLSRKGTEKTRWTRKEVETLRGIKTKYLYQYATYTTPEGAVISGVEGRKYERRAAAKKGLERKRQREWAESQSIIAKALIENFRDESNYWRRWRAKTVYQKAMQWLDGAIAKYGELRVGMVLMEYPEEVKIVYASYDETIDHNLSLLDAKLPIDHYDEIEEVSRDEDATDFREDNGLIRDMFGV